ncbi:MAG: deoxyribodipyrimidine photo-lyase, partial [Myxococcaceae bacterium]
CLKALAPRKPLAIPPLDIFAVNENRKFAVQDQSWTKKLESHWEIGEQAAQKYLNKFLENNLEDYAKNRDFPAQNATSKLSPHLHFGEISPHQIEWSIDSKFDPFLRQLIWREFSYYLLFHFPHFPEKNYQSKFNHFPWKENAQLLRAWQQGQTGYPLVDAGMRELWQTGTMHNRVRMIAASFLVKNLNIHWHNGANWFWNCLLDADLANNSVSWQWVAGSGVDASPFFRIFNPTTQGEKFDPEGDYTRRFVPELSQIPKKYLFKPWEAVNPPKNYPAPIIDLKTSREEALKAFKALS